MMNITYSFFSLEGAYQHTVSGPFDIVIEPSISVWDGYAVEGGPYDETHWHNGTEVALRPVNPAELDGLTLRNVPPASTIIINSQSYDCPDGGDVELEFDQPGTYTVRVICWPYLDKEFTVENPAQ